MKSQPIVFNKTDRHIMESYKILAQGLANYLGDGYEIVIHSMESLENSVVQIENGHHSGRTEGSPITDLGLSLLADIQNNPLKRYVSYFNKSKSGEPLKSCTISIKGENDKIIGLLCINFYMNTPLMNVLKSLFPSETISTEGPVPESFTDNIDDLIHHSLTEVKTAVYNDRSISASNKNKEIITQLYKRGIFQLKDSVVKIADKLDISKNTVYMHLRNLSK